MMLSDMENAIGEARATLNRADQFATQLARLLKGRLWKVDNGYLLNDLKRELRAFDGVTKTWKESA